MLGTLDEKVKTFLHVLRRKGGVINTVVVVATAKGLIAKSLDEHLKCLDIDSSYWAKSLFRRMGLRSEHAPNPNRKSQNWQKKEAKLIF